MANLQAIELSDAYSAYISAFTAGEISRQSSIVIQFVTPVVEPGDVGKGLEDDSWLTFNLDVAGTTRWNDPYTLEFTPAGPLPPATAIKGVLLLDPLFQNVPDELKRFVFNVWTPPRSYEITTLPLRASGNNSLETQILEGRVISADFEDAGVVESIVSGRHMNKAVAFRWEHAEDGRTHTFFADAIQRTEAPTELMIRWDATELGVDLKGEETITVHPIQSFAFTGARALFSPERHVEITFSDPLQAGQNLDGLLRVGDHDLRLRIEGNQIFVHPASSEHTFSGNVVLHIEAGIRNVVDQRILVRLEIPLVFEEIKPAVELTGSGVIMPTSAHLPFAFRAVNLKSVDVRISKIYQANLQQFFQVNSIDHGKELHRVSKMVQDTLIDLEQARADLKQWSTYALDLNTLIQPDPGAIYRVSIGFRKSYSLYPCAAVEAGTGEAEERERSTWDPPIYEYYDEFEGDSGEPIDREDACQPAYYSTARSVSRNVLASDLGLAAKRGAGGDLHVYVTDLHTASPVAGVELEVFDFSQQSIARANSDGQGMARLKLATTPYLLIARRGEQRGYLKLQEGLSLPVSRFDIGGTHAQRGLRGFLYGERGVWRPGDDLYFTFILDDTRAALPDDHPVVFEFRNPRGQLVERIVQTESVNDFYAFRTRTAANDPTGTYTATVRVGGATFSQPVRVETIMPNRLKIDLDFGGAFLVSDASSKNAALNILWLHGAPAPNLKADVQATLTRTNTRFDRFETFVFDDPSRPYAEHNVTLFDKAVDAQGRATFPISVTANDQAPGVLRATISTKVFEPGGAFSTDQMSIPYHPYVHYVGIEPPAMRNRYGVVPRNSEYRFDIATVDREGQPAAREGVVLDLYHVGWSWWWDAQDNTTHFNTRQLSQPVARDTVTTGASGTATAVMGLERVEGGRYLLRACDPDGHCSGQFFYVAWSDRASRKDNQPPGGETLLDFSSDKETYSVGETVTLRIPSPAEGRALITLESGDGILSSHWVSTEKGTTTFQFEVTADMAPNLYAGVMLLQPHAQTANDLPIRLYGVLPIPVFDADTRLLPQIAMGDELRPEETATLTISESQGKPMTYTVAIVDEGLLDLTRFSTPNPWDYFFARQALATKTWDLYDHVLGASSMAYQALLGIGGGDEGEEGQASKVNRFTPVVGYLGPFTLKANESRTHTFDMPMYVGAVRTMVVAGQDGAFGAAETTTPVRKPVMLLGTLPRVLGPEEDVDFYLSVFAMNDAVRQVDVEITTSELLTSTASTRQTVTFTRAGEQVVAFPLKVARGTGTASVRAVARSSGEVATYAFDIEVRQSNVPEIVLIDTLLAPGASWTYQPDLVGVPGTNSGSVEVTSLPPLNLARRLTYLITYPHGCIEQTTSAVFPQLFLPDLIPLSTGRKAGVQRNIEAGINRLIHFQNTGGGLSYWPGQPEINMWGTNYAGHFMLLASKFGYSVPAEFLASWLDFQRKQANEWATNPVTNRTDLIQAYRLYLLALADVPQLGAMNRYREGRYGTNVEKWLLAAAYHLAGQPEAARDISRTLNWQLDSYVELSYTYGSTLRDKALIVHALTTMGRATEAFPLVKDISEALMARTHMSTQTTAYSLMGILGYATSYSDDFALDYQLAGEPAQSVRSEEPLYEIDLALENDTPKPLTLTNRSAGPLHVAATLRGTPPLGNETDAANRMTLAVVYKDMQGGVISPDRLAQGTDFFAEVTVGNPSAALDIREVALTQIFPSGWEIHRMRRSEAKSSAYATPTFQDVRDDRVYTYFDLPPAQNRASKPTTRTFRVLLNASYRGRFYLPAVSAEAMYDADIHARIKGRWVEVVAAEN